MRRPAFVGLIWIVLRSGSEASAGSLDVADADDVCAAGAACAADKAKPRASSPYAWPMARGPIGSFGTSPSKGPRNLATAPLSKASFGSFQFPGGRFDSPPSNGALLIDDRKDMYTMRGNRILKMTPTLQILWQFDIEGGANDIPALMDGMVFATSLAGHALALDMESGSVVWQSAKVCTWKSQTRSKCHDQCDCGSLGGDIGAVAAHDGVIVMKTHAPPGGGSCRIAGLNASTGDFLWDYAPDRMIWNFYPMYSEDGKSIFFQDSTGGVYNVRAADGKEIWKAGIDNEVWYQTWTDGGAQLGPNGVVYAVKAYANNEGPGTVRAFRASDGKFLWESPQMPEAPNAWPVIGRLRKEDPLTVIAPFGRAGGYFPDTFFWVVKKNCSAG